MIMPHDLADTCASYDKGGRCVIDDPVITKDKPSLLGWITHAPAPPPVYFWPEYQPPGSGKLIPKTCNVASASTFALVIIGMIAAVWFASRRI